MRQPRKKNEALYFALRNAKLRIGVVIVLLFGPLLTKNEPRDYVAPGAQPPSSEYWFGTTSFGEDVFTQFVYGLRATFIVGLIGGGLGTLIGILVGFIAGYFGGIVDEILNMFTNIVLVVPSLVVLLIIAAYLQVRGLVF
jgi:peptide/nickel transport system permease protein